MKVQITVTILVLTHFLTFSQETLLKKYVVKNQIHNLELMIFKNIKYESLNLIQQQGIKDKFKLLSEINYSQTDTIKGKEVIINKKKKVTADFYKEQVIKLPRKVLLPINKHAHVKLIKDKLFVNPIETDEVYFYQLKSGNEFELNFSEWTVTALTIPIKYRFRQKNIEEDFAASINLNMFIGRSYGGTNFMYRKGVDNKINNWKFSGGIILGTSTITLTSNNTSSSDNPILENDTFNKGLLSIGIGGAYSFNNINFGLFYGYDYGIGKSANRWDYNKKPWLGIAIGYSILKF